RWPRSTGDLGSSRCGKLGGRGRSPLAGRGVSLNADFPIGLCGSGRSELGTTRGAAVAAGGAKRAAGAAGLGGGSTRSTIDAVAGYCGRGGGVGRVAAASNAESVMSSTRAAGPATGWLRFDSSDRTWPASRPDGVVVAAACAVGLV